MPSNTSLLAVFTAIALAITLPSAAQQQPEPTPQNTEEPAPELIDFDMGNAFCPVTQDEAADPNFSTVYEGRTIYFCCKMCRTKFGWNPEQYLDNLPPLATPASLAQLDDLIDPEASTSAEDEIYGDDDHDHADLADDGPDLMKILSYLGRFHVVAIHFPIALLLLGALFEFVSLFTNNDRALGTVRISIALGACSAILAASLGLANAIGVEYVGTLADVFWWHRALGITTAALAILAWIAVERRARKPSLRATLAARATVLLVAACVGITGHLGGSLVFGWTYFMP